MANATSYQVKVYAADGTTPLPATLQPVETTTLTQTVAGLNGSTDCQFSVTAKNAGGSSEESD